MYGLLLTLHIVICFALIVVVLLQSGKGGGLAGGAFGGTAQTVFGGRGANDFMTRATMFLGAAFFVTSMALALMSSGTQGSRSLMQEAAKRASSQAPPTMPTSKAPATAPQTAPAGGGSQAPAQPAPAQPSGPGK
jgi:preprotein translocase subunit SecG